MILCYGTDDFIAYAMNKSAFRFREGGSRIEIYAGKTRLRHNPEQSLLFGSRAGSIRHRMGTAAHAPAREGKRRGQCAAVRQAFVPGPKHNDKGYTEAGAARLCPHGGQSERPPYPPRVYDGGGAAGDRGDNHRDTQMGADTHPGYVGRRGGKRAAADGKNGPQRI